MGSGTPAKENNKQTIFNLNYLNNNDRTMLKYMVNYSFSVIQLATFGHTKKHWGEKNKIKS